MLDDEGKAVGPWDPKLDPDTLRKMLRDMKTVRVFDDRMYRAQRQGKTSFYMKCTGEEAIAVAAATRSTPRTCTSRPIASRACWSRAAIRWSR